MNKRQDAIDIMLETMDPDTMMSEIINYLSDDTVIEMLVSIARDYDMDAEEALIERL